MLTDLHSVLVQVPDLDVARDDYARLLGAPPVLAQKAAEGEARRVVFGVANTRLELRWDPTADRFGQSGLRFATDDPATADELATRGLEVEDDIEERWVDEGSGAEQTIRIRRLAGGTSRGLPVELVDADAVGEALRRSADAAAVRALDHVVVMSPAPDDTADFYGARLGIRLALDKTFDARGVRLLFFRLGGTTVEIGARAGVDPEPGKSDRFGGLAWQVPDIDAIQSRLAGDGFDVSEIRKGHKPGTRVCTVRDPVHGVPTLLIEPVAG